MASSTNPSANGYSPEQRYADDISNCLTNCDILKEGVGHVCESYGDGVLVRLILKDGSEVKESVAYPEGSQSEKARNLTKDEVSDILSEFPSFNPLLK